MHAAETRSKSDCYWTWPSDLEYTIQHCICLRWYRTWCSVTRNKSFERKNLSFTLSGLIININWKSKAGKSLPSFDIVRYILHNFICVCLRWIEIIWRTTCTTLTTYSSEYYYQFGIWTGFVFLQMFLNYNSKLLAKHDLQTKLYFMQHLKVYEDLDWCNITAGQPNKSVNCTTHQLYRFSKSKLRYN